MIVPANLRYFCPRYEARVDRINIEGNVGGIRPNDIADDLSVVRTFGADGSLI
jgi:hypothetical protein